MAISPLPPVPLRSDTPSTFIAKADAFLAALSTFRTEANALAAAITQAANLDSSGNPLPVVSAFIAALLDDVDATTARATLGISNSGANLINNSVSVDKLTRAASNKVLLGMGAEADPVWADLPFTVANIPAASLDRSKLAASVVPKVKAFAKQQAGDLVYANFAVKMADDSLRVWGRTGALSLGINETGDTTALASGPVFNVAPPAGVGVKEFVMTCGSMWVLMSNGWVYACGQNNFGQLGHGDTTARSVLTRIEYFVTNAITVDKLFATGSRNSPAYASAYFLNAAGNVWSCGYNASGQLGAGNQSSVTVPTAISGAISAASAIICGGSNDPSVFLLTTGGDLYACGRNSQGQLGLNDTNNRSSFTFVRSGVAQIACATSYSDPTNWTWAGASILLTASGDVYTCGYGSYGLGHGSTSNLNVFTKIASLANIVSIGVGGGFYPYMWAISSAGRMFVWGYNGQGVLGTGGMANAASPVDVASWSGNVAQDPPFVGKIAKVASGPPGFGSQSLVVLDTDGKLWFSGHDYGYFCGNTAVQRNRFTPVLLPMLSAGEKIIDLQMRGYDGTYRLFCLTNDNNLYAMGENSWGVCQGGHNNGVPEFVKSLQKVPL